LEPDEVVADYFAKAGLGGLTLNTVVTEDSNYRSVSTVAELDLNTYFLRLIDMDTLGAVANSTAIEGVGNIEVSLVVDISGSMAANVFVTTLLTDDTRDRVSLSFVPYSAHVNAGPDIFNQFNTNSVHNFSHCIDFPDTAYETTEINTTLPLDQAQHWQWNAAYNNDGDRIPLVGRSLA